jgi:hypothetical protein
MSWQDKQVCPVCEAPCKEALPTMGDYREMICEECGRYRITRTAEVTFKELGVAERKEKLSAAKTASSGTIPKLFA